MTNVAYVTYVTILSYKSHWHNAPRSVTHVAYGKAAPAGDPFRKIPSPEHNTIADFALHARVHPHAPGEVAPCDDDDVPNRPRILCR